MIIGHIGNFESFTDVTANGVKQAVYHLAVSQAALGHKVFVYLFNSTREIKYEVQQGVTVISFPRHRLKGFYISTDVKKHMEKNVDKLDILHFHSVFIPTNNLLARLIKIPYVITPHGGYSPNCFKRSKISALKKRIYFPLLEKKYILNAACIFCLEENERTTLPYFEITKKRSVVIPNGIGKNKSHLVSKAERLLFIGRLDMRHKGLDNLIDGFNLYHKSGIKLCIAGPDVCGDKALLESKVREYHLQDCVEIKPPVFGEEKEKLYENADVFVHTSRWEGLPISVLEAMSHGLPVLISKETNLARYVESYGAGIVIESCTPKCICQGLKQLEALNISECSVHAVNLTEDEFDWAVISENMVEKYSEIL